VLRIGLLIVGVGLVTILILDVSGSLDTWDPTTETLQALGASMLAILVGGLLSLIALVRLAIGRLRPDRGDGSMPRVTPL
jgi:hypothetical protein